ncbi:MAG: pseudouridine-5'-phosphate glycosidase, partial [Nocardioides sp.]
FELGLRSGLVVANPIPAADEIGRADMDAVIAVALADADRLRIGGKDITPYLLGRIAELTDGASLTANVALVRHNARFGAAVACAFNG